jgi:hypothetical protein
MSRRITIFEHALAGYGCFKREIEVADDKVVSETPDTIIVKEMFCYGDELDTTYFKTVDAFIANEKMWFRKNVEELTERHEHTLKLAEALK